MKHLIVNADDFGYWPSVNRGIVDSHVRGVVTSASLMVTGHAVAEAVALGSEHPELSIGLHFDVWGEDEREFPTGDGTRIREEFLRQLDTFEALLGRLPTHVDSHRHVHREEHLFPLFQELVEPLGVPLRGNGDVRYVGGFYAQWEWGVTNLEHVGVQRLQEMLRDEVADGWTEFGCHPGYVDGLVSVYAAEREAEVGTLTDPRVARTIDELGITLASYADYTVR